MALAEEEDFLNSLSGAETLNAYQQDRIFELHKDMLQELEGLRPEGVRLRLESSRLNSESAIESQFSYCKEHFSQYKNQTSRKYNWAGTSEFIAIGRILERQVVAFGRDLYPTVVDKQENVQPYYSSASVDSTNASFPIVIFQCGGGGHYRRLVPPQV